MASHSASAVAAFNNSSNDNSNYNYNPTLSDFNEATTSQLNEDLRILQAQLDTFPALEVEEDSILSEERQVLEIQIISIQEELSRLKMGSVLSPPIAISDDEDEGNGQNSDSYLRPLPSTAYSSRPSSSASSRKRKIDEEPSTDASRNNKNQKIIPTPYVPWSATYTEPGSSKGKSATEDSDYELAKRLDAEWNSIGNDEWMSSMPSTSRGLSSTFDQIDLTGIDEDGDFSDITMRLPSTSAKPSASYVGTTMPPSNIKNVPLSYAPGRHIKPDVMLLAEPNHNEHQIDWEAMDTRRRVKPETKSEDNAKNHFQSWNDWFDDGVIDLDAESPEHWWETNYSRERLHPIFSNRRIYDDEPNTNEKEELQKILQEIRPDEVPSPEGRELTPKEMKINLMEHQKIGLGWLKTQEDGRAKGGILADDMGLGKTVQALALIIDRKSEDQKRKTTLIVAPVALLRQWRLEIEQKLKPEHRLTVYLHHGNQKKLKTFDEMARYDVVLTSYGTLGGEFKKKTLWEHRNAPYPEIKPEDTDFPFLGDGSLWYRIILDEAQYIKNHNTLSSKACALLHSTFRLCLSGTPIQNSAEEFYSLLRFLRYRPYNDHKKFQRDIGRGLKAKSSVERQASLQRLQAIIKLILLRRLKTSLIDGKSILTLPPKRVDLVHAVFSDDERQFYDALAARAVLQFNKYLREGTAMKNYSYILVLLLRLRQAACHPHLIKDIEKAADLEAEGGQIIKDLLGEFSEETVNRVREAGGAFDCPVCYDITENPKLVVSCGHELCSECLVRVVNKHAVDAGARGDDEAGPAKCPQCRGPIHTDRVVDYVTFREHFFPDAVNDEILGVDDLSSTKDDADSDLEDDEEEEEDLSSNSDDESDDGDDLNGFIVPDDYESDSDEFLRDDGTEDFQKIFGKSRSQPSLSKNERSIGTKVTTKSDNKLKGSKKGKGKAPKKSKKARGKQAKPRKKLKTMAEKRREAFRTKKGKEKYMAKLSKNWISSAKIDKCLEILESIKEVDPKEKTIIFSQFTSLLDLVEVPLLQRGFNYTRYDGSMNPTDRNEAVLEFQDEGKNISVMLISLKAGNAGLNLVSASQVIILDPFWNGSVEDQAIDRAHRIGQTRDVYVHKIVIENTIEDRILELQRQKRELIESALDENAAKAISRLGERELGYLFGINSLAGQEFTPPMRRVAGRDI